jgi:hypothetical protein
MCLGGDPGQLGYTWQSAQEREVPRGCGQADSEKWGCKQAPGGRARLQELGHLFAIGILQNVVFRLQR